MTRRRCPDCRGAKIVWKVPNVHALHPGLAGEGEVSTVRCARCRTSGYVLIDRDRNERPGIPDHIVL